MGLERGPLSIVSTNEELLGRNKRGSGQENRDYCRRDPSRWSCSTIYPQKLALTSPSRGGRSVGIIRSRTKATGILLLLLVVVVVVVRLEEWINESLSQQLHSAVEKEWPVAVRHDHLSKGRPILEHAKAPDGARNEERLWRLEFAAIWWTGLPLQS
jgi:hypothetical protein